MKWILAIRNLLLRELKEQFGQKRLDELGEFLRDYLAQRLNGDDSDTQDLAQLRSGRHWYIQSLMRQRVSSKGSPFESVEVQQQDRGEILRLAR
jgi:dephospho-CoA kinase